MSDIDHKPHKHDSSYSIEACNGEKLSIPEYLVAGAIAGTASMVVGHPMDTIKTLQQANVEKKTNLTNCIKNVYHCGMGRFFRGLSTPFMSYALVNAVIFSSDEFAAKELDIKDHDKQYSKVFLAGMFSGFAQLSVCVPVEVVKIRMQNTATQSGGQATARQTIKAIYKQKGLKGFYAGTIPHGARDIPATGIYFLTYEWCKDQLIEKHHYNELAATFLAGAFSGISSWVTTVPCDVVKTRVQSGVDASTIESVKALRTLGLNSFFSGFVMTVVRAFFVNATLFTAFEVASQYILENRGTSWREMLSIKPNVALAIKAETRGDSYNFTKHSED